MDENTTNQIALFRYGIIAPLVTRGEFTPSERGQFCDAAAKKYQFINGDYVTVSVDYVYRYYRKYAQGGYDALKPGGRSDIGKVRKLDDDTVSSIKYLHTEYPRLPATMIYQKLIENGTITARKVSLSMADQEKLIRMNALGTVHVNQEFAKYMQKDSVLLDVSFNSAYAIPNFLLRDKMILLAETDEEAFVKKLIHMSNLVHDEYKRRGFAYALSKNFVCRYAQMCAFKYGSRGIRVLSVSPGFVSTDMGKSGRK